jgi:protein-tyrosine-phosphatase
MRVVLAMLAAALLPGAVMAQGSDRVVFVCEHGNVKSLIASQWFDRLAAERGLAVRAVSRGLSPEQRVPGAIADRLRGDGFEVAAFVPRALAPADLEGTVRLVMIGAEAPAWIPREAVTVERWDGIPPASERYEASRDALRSRLDALVAELGAKTPAR